MGRSKKAIGPASVDTASERGIVTYSESAAAATAATGPTASASDCGCSRSIYDPKW